MELGGWASEEGLEGLQEEWYGKACLERMHSIESKVKEAID